MGKQIIREELSPLNRVAQQNRYQEGLDVLRKKILDQREDWDFSGTARDLEANGNSNGHVTTRYPEWVDRMLRDCGDGLPPSTAVPRDGGHVFLVEMHVYFYHILDHFPGYCIPKLPNSTNGAENSEREEVECTITTRDGISTMCVMQFPKIFNDVMEFYLYETDPPVFFPSYDYHTFRGTGVELNNMVYKVTHPKFKDSPLGQDRLIYLSDLMVDHGFNIQSIRFKTARGMDTSLLLSPSNRIVPTNDFIYPKGDRKAIITSTCVDLRPICPPIFDQGDLGTCGISALTSFLEFVTGTRLSALFLYYNARCDQNIALDYDSGVELHECLHTLSTYGICRYESWPYLTAKFSEKPPSSAFEEAEKFKPQDFLLLHNIDEMKKTLQRGFVFFADINFAPRTYTRTVEITGKIPAPANVAELNDAACEHSVMVVGFNDSTREFMFQNSWGTEWGDGGYGYLPYFYLEEKCFRNAYTWGGEKPTNVYSVY